MIPMPVLQKTIDDFNKKYNDLLAKLKDVKEPTDEHLEWFQMNEAMMKLRDVVEFELLPFVSKEDN